MGEGLDRFKHLQLARFDDCNDLFSRDRGKGFEKIFDGFTTFEVINQILQRNARSYEHRGAAHNFGITMYDACKFFRAHDSQYTTSDAYTNVAMQRAATLIKSDAVLRSLPIAGTFS